MAKGCTHPKGEGLQARHPDLRGPGTASGLQRHGLQCQHRLWSFLPGAPGFLDLVVHTELLIPQLFTKSQHLPTGCSPFAFLCSVLLPGGRGSQPRPCRWRFSDRREGSGHAGILLESGSDTAGGAGPADLCSHGPPVARVTGVGPSDLCSHEPPVARVTGAGPALRGAWRWST